MLNIYIYMMSRGQKLCTAALLFKPEIIKFKIRNGLTKILLKSFLSP